MERKRATAKQKGKEGNRRKEGRRERRKERKKKDRSEQGWGKKDEIVYW